MRYNSLNVKKLISLDFEKDLIDKSYVSKVRSAKEFLTHTRFDISFKILFLKMKDVNYEFAKYIYKEHIRAFSLGEFTEPGNEGKNNIEKFFEEFYNIFEDIKINGFDSNKTLIPLSKNGSIVDGAHRVASAIFLNQNVECVNIGTYDQKYDYKFFYSRRVSSQVLDMVATNFLEYASDTYIAFIWPTAKGHEKEVKEIIPNIVYEKLITLNANGAHNLLSQVYTGERWLGNVENNFIGVRSKLAACFETFDTVRVFAFQEKSLNRVLEVKDRVRELFGKEQHSIHITDTKEETIKAAYLVFNDNSLHFLNHAKPNKYLSTHHKISECKKFIKINKLTAEDVLCKGDMVLSLYGLIEIEKTSLPTEEIDKKDTELLYNPENYFYFNGLKFASFKQVYQMKKNRNTTQDTEDLKIMNELVEKNYAKNFLEKIKQSIYYTVIRLSSKVLRKIGLYEVAKYIFRKINSW